MTISDDLLKARSIASELATDATRCIAWLAIWARANPRNDDVRSRYNETYEAHALDMIADALHIAMIMALLRMHDRDSRAASIPSLLRLLESPRVLAELKDLSPLQNKNIDAWLRSAIDLYESLKDEEILATLRKLRNHVIAHVELDKATLHEAKYGYEEELLDRTNQIANLLYLITHGDEFDIATAWAVWQEYADAFWSSAINSPRHPLTT